MAEKKATFSTVKWQGTAGIEEAHSLKDELLKAFQNSNGILLDISEVEDIDITGIQVIVAARKEAEKQGKQFYITGNVPESISEFISKSSITLNSYILPEEYENA